MENELIKKLETPIEDLDLSVRAHSCLKVVKINSLGELVRYKMEDLMKFRNFGQKSIAEIEQVLHERGLDFGMRFSFEINYLNLKKAAMVLRSMNHKLRQQILALIDSEKKITVTEIYVRLRLEQSVASQHLAILRKSGIVVTQRDGKFIYYTINYKRIEEINQFVQELID